MGSVKVEREVTVSQEGNQRTPLTLEGLAAAVSALELGTPADARVYLRQNSGGEWSITAKWTPNPDAPDPTARALEVPPYLKDPEPVYRLDVNTPDLPEGTVPLPASWRSGLI